MYQSTRGRAARVPFREVLLEGLAPDGGLYVPAEPISLDPSSIVAGSYEELAAAVLEPFVAGEYAPGEVAGMIEDAYAPFDHVHVAPLTRLGGQQEWLMELFHGPTLAFKDIALQLLARLFAKELEDRDRTMTVVGATSGDTGSAAIHACAGIERLEVFMLQPAGRVSEIQRKQMTTVHAPNIHNLAIDGTFDDCQRLVKELFAVDSFRSRRRLGAVNSINWARVAAQCVYYAFATQVLRSPVDFIVPTGNLGNAYAALLARRLGFAVETVTLATNSNDILARTHADGLMEAQAVVPTISPSMDIQVSSNFERLLFDLSNGDTDFVAASLSDFARTGRLTLSRSHHVTFRESVMAGSATEAETRATMRQVYEETGRIVDPHTAVGIAVGRKTRKPGSLPAVYMATAHPAKFPDVVEEAIGVRPDVPGQLEGILAAEERLHLLPADLDEVMAFIDGAAIL